MSLPAAFNDEVDALCKKHGYDQWLVVVAEAESEDETRFQASLNCFSEGMAEYLGIVAQEITDNLDEHEEDSL